MLGKGLHGLDDRRFGESLQDIVLRTRTHPLTLHRPIKVKIVHVIEFGFLGAPGFGPKPVDVGVGHDAKEPRPKVRAFGEAGVCPVGLEVRLLYQILGVGPVAG